MGIEISMIPYCQDFLNNEKYSDVKFIFAEKVIHAHKIILGSQSSVFAAMFDNNMKESNENRVEITDMDFNIFQEMLRFLYCRDVENFEFIAKDLFIAADKYALEELRDKCEECLCKSVSMDNILEYLRIADTYSAEKLKQKVKEFMTENAEDIVMMPDFEEILELDKNLIISTIRTLVSSKKLEK